VKQAIRSSLGIASMVAIGLFIMGTASEAQATSGGCFLPSFAVDMLLDEAPDGFVSSQKRCREQCGQIHTTCRRVANSAATCLRALFKGESAFEGIGCTEEENVRECRADVRNDFSGAPGFIREDLMYATGECADARGSCRDSCNND
jgi:hypothetical protein